MPDLSVIIPIYNTPLDKLERGFLSVLSLEGCSFEVLLIDDGSQTSVGDFCKDFADKHPAFRYIYKENGGVSSARNLGLDQAQGRYVTFMDADDTLLGGPLVRCLPESDGPDMIVFDMGLSQRGSNTVWHAFNLPGGSITRQQFLYQLFTSSSISGPCAKLYKSQILQQRQIRFDTEFIAGEDWMFVCDCALQMETFYYCDQTSYLYFREDSSGQSRLVRYPDKVLDNQLIRHARKQEVVAQQQWTEYKSEQILSLSAVELIEGLFNSACDLWLSKQYNSQRKERIRSAVAEASVFLSDSIPKKTKLKLFVLTRFPVGLWPLALLRALYLKKK